MTHDPSVDPPIPSAPQVMPLGAALLKATDEKRGTPVYELMNKNFPPAVVAAEKEIMQSIARVENIETLIKKDSPSRIDPLMKRIDAQRDKMTKTLKLLRLARFMIDKPDSDKALLAVVLESAQMHLEQA